MLLQTDSCIFWFNICVTIYSMDSQNSKPTEFKIGAQINYSDMFQSKALKPEAKPT